MFARTHITGALQRHELQHQEAPTHSGFRRRHLVLVTLGAVVVFLLLSRAAAAGETANPAASDRPQKAAVEVIVSPTFGTFLAASEPGETPWVKVGKMVDSETPVGMVEPVMVGSVEPAKTDVGDPRSRMMVLAGVRGKIVQVLVADGEIVMMGQPLFRVLPIREPGDR